LPLTTPDRRGDWRRAQDVEPSRRKCVLRRRQRGRYHRAMRELQFADMDLFAPVAELGTVSVLKIRACIDYWAEWFVQTAN
jgi:hypothetical protein